MTQSVDVVGKLVVVTTGSNVISVAFGSISSALTSQGALRKWRRKSGYAIFAPSSLGAYCPPRGLLDRDDGPPWSLLPFRPGRVQGFQLPGVIRTRTEKSRYLSVVEFFQMFFTLDVVERLCQDKPTKWGMKLWVIADPETGYTYNFDVYLGKDTGMQGDGGLAYNVMKLVKRLVGKGCRIFFDKFYTTVTLMKDLFMIGIGACGTILFNRRGFPTELKNIKEFEKGSKRGDYRWSRDEEVLTVQWRDNKTISVMSTFHEANSTEKVTRRTKVDNKFERIEVTPPTGPELKTPKLWQGSTGVCPELGLDENSSALDCLFTLLTNEFLDELLVSINSYAADLCAKNRPACKQSVFLQFEPIYKDEFFRFLAILLAMGVNPR
ncbi:hypothetical protein RRG08_038749 [Elysia crispata]|uniref:PiggyBac transposable element-derived protein domain-containing protein n=1 Tax=Elysia crispata TaxID=231223 RepID=A0AAE0Y0F4_9GAST|nr:hypothetical protein RRG08_038749 [Elysia crispata]